MFLVDNGLVVGNAIDSDPTTMTIAICQALNILRKDDWSTRLSSITFVKGMRGVVENEQHQERVSVKSGLVAKCRPASVRKSMPNDVKLILFGIDINKQRSSQSLQMELKFETVDNLLSWEHEEERAIKRWVDSLVQNGVNTLITSGEVDNIVLHYLNLANMLVFKRINIVSLQHVSRLSNAPIIHSEQYSIDVSNTKNVGTLISILPFNDGLDWDDNQSSPFYYHFFVDNVDQRRSSLATIVINESDFVFQSMRKQGQDILYGLAQLLDDDTNHFIKIDNSGELETLLSNHIHKKAQQESTSIMFALDKYAEALSSVRPPQVNILNHSLRKNVYKSATDLACILIQVQNFIESQTTPPSRS
ncbi:hypothetical protein SAMD00019534_122840 [Acytostelium subglobosum LB1]|uniref:hypothetical protein n=1 Tax=Acytostelium subglobosum LB1 TaxID=1410327 RepID=UPI0006452394|nr:hypothetical protein SAMD00019534_122840 [Acytostelium subglobosum LB1]GAM29108.1 hypothetical protein SAMD00019534_122840 [Acytostelium subglobosum LB1]|eukprot:XP_012747953.1 hypothetical protein SAMD00019534_122840 [Acytostelium subglobosum LB1]